MATNDKDKRDIYYRLAKKLGYRARSAFKLLQIEEEFQIFHGVKTVVDLCAAPGSWSQVIASKIGGIAKIISVDMQEIIPLKDVHFIHSDITTNECKDLIFSAAQSKIDLILFDGAPDVTGIIDVDEYHQTVLLKEALSITTKIAQLGATFVGKCFRSEDTGFIISHFKKFFNDVILVKPRSSRNSSHECFLLCRGFFKSDYDPRFLDVNLVPEKNELVLIGSGPNSDLSLKFLDDGKHGGISPVNPPFMDVLACRREMAQKKSKP